MSCGKPLVAKKLITQMYCAIGYEFKNGSKNECLPICDFCESGNCTGPSKCTCWDNYEEQELVQGKEKVHMNYIRKFS